MIFKCFCMQYMKKISRLTKIQVDKVSDQFNLMIKKLKIQDLIDSLIDLKIIIEEIKKK